MQMYYLQPTKTIAFSLKFDSLLMSMLLPNIISWFQCQHIALANGPEIMVCNHCLPPDAVPPSKVHLQLMLHSPMNLQLFFAAKFAKERNMPFFKLKANRVRQTPWASCIIEYWRGEKYTMLPQNCQGTSILNTLYSNQCRVTLRQLLKYQGISSHCFSAGDTVMGMFNYAARSHL